VKKSRPSIGFRAAMRLYWGNTGLEAAMSDTLSFSRKAFRRGVDEALTLKPLRRVLWGDRAGAVETGRAAGETRRVTVAKSGQRSWHVKRSS
jgi:hypothetical protein